MSAKYVKEYAEPALLALQLARKQADYLGRRGEIQHPRMSNQDWPGRCNRAFVKSTVFQPLPCFSTFEHNMRLTQEQINGITQTVGRLLGTGAEVFLFGSRLDDAARGGDVDVLIETDTRLGLIERARVKMELEASLGLPVDIVAHARNLPLSPFHRMVKSRAVKLESQL